MFMSAKQYLLSMRFNIETTSACRIIAYAILNNASIFRFTCGYDQYYRLIHTD